MTIQSEVRGGRAVNQPPTSQRRAGSCRRRTKDDDDSAKRSRAGVARAAWGICRLAHEPCVCPQSPTVCRGGLEARAPRFGSTSRRRARASTATSGATTPTEAQRPLPLPPPPPPHRAAAGPYYASTRRPARDATALPRPPRSTHTHAGRPNQTPGATDETRDRHNRCSHENHGTARNKPNAYQKAFLVLFFFCLADRHNRCSTDRKPTTCHFWPKITLAILKSLQ